MEERERIDCMEQARAKAMREYEAYYQGQRSRDMFFRDIVKRPDKKHGIDRTYHRTEWREVRIEEVPYVVVLPNRYETSIIDAAILLEDWDIPLNQEIVIVDMQERDELAEGITGHSWQSRDPLPAFAEFLDALVAYGNVIMDYRDDAFPFKFEQNGASRWDSVWHYNGLRPYKPHVMDVRDNFISTISRYWTGSFINGYKSPRNSSGANLSLQRATNLAHALSLGMISFDAETLRKVKAPGWHRDAFRKVRFSDTSLPEEIADLDENVEKAESLMAFWENAADYYRFCMRIDREELDDVEKLCELCRQCAEMIGVDGYLDTYSAGVPAEDILA